MRRTDCGLIRTPIEPKSHLESGVLRSIFKTVSIKLRPVQYHVFHGSLAMNAFAHWGMIAAVSSFLNHQFTTANQIPPLRPHTACHISSSI